MDRGAAFGPVALRTAALMLITAFPPITATVFRYAVPEAESYREVIVMRAWAGLLSGRRVTLAALVGAGRFGVPSWS
jgi:hypothetical protein